MPPIDTLDDKVNAIGTQLAVLTSRFTRMDQDFEVLRAETRASTKETEKHHEDAKKCLIDLSLSLEKFRDTMFTSDERHALKEVVKREEDRERASQQIDVTVRSNAKVMKWTATIVVFSSIVAPIVLKLLGV